MELIKIPREKTEGSPIMSTKSFVKKRSFFSELGRDNRAATIQDIIFVLIFIFGAAPLMGYLVHKYASQSSFDFAAPFYNPDYFVYIASGIPICFLLFLAAVFVDAIYLYFVSFTRYLKAINKSTYLPLTKEEIETAGITNIYDYIKYVYDQLVYVDPWEKDKCQCKIYSSPELQKDIQNAMESYFGKDTNINIVLFNLFKYYGTFIDKTMTDTTWKHLCLDHAINDIDYRHEELEEEESI